MSHRITRRWLLAAVTTLATASAGLLGASGATALPAADTGSSPTFQAVAPSGGPNEIVGGTQSTTTYPWMTRLTVNYNGASFSCGGTLVSKDIILTAQHCLDYSDKYGNPTSVDAYIGNNYYPSGTRRSSTTWRLGSGIEKGDWAVIKLSSPLTLSTYPVLPADTTNNSGPSFKAMGWGATSEGGSGTTNLREVIVPFVADSLCTNYPNAEICAGNYDFGGIDTCQGDSGGPLFKINGSQYVQVGITSWGNGCARAKEPGHYTQVSTYLPSIQSSISALGGSPVTTTAGGGTPTDPDPTDPSVGTLTNGVPVTIAATSPNSVLYKIVVPSGASNLKIATSGGTGDADLYVKAGSQPTDTSYDCRPYKSGNAEECVAAAPTAGTYYVRVKAFSSFSGVSLVASYSTSGGGTPVPSDQLSNGVSKAISGATGSETYYYAQIPAGTSKLTVTTAGGTGDLDLYVKQGSKPTNTSYDCRPFTTGNNETCTIDYPASGQVWIRLRGYSAYSGATLTASWS